LCQYIFGDLTVVVSQELKYRGNHQGYVGQFRSNQGVPINFSIIANNPVGVGISCVFANGERWVLSPIEKLEVFFGYSVDQPTPQNPYKKYAPVLLDTQVAKSNIMPGVEEQMKEFLNQQRVIGSSLREFGNLMTLVREIKNTND
jgi:hypothetical protein